MSKKFMGEIWSEKCDTMSMDDEKPTIEKMMSSIILGDSTEVPELVTECKYRRGYQR